MKLNGRRKGMTGISLRLSDDTIKRISELAKALSKPGFDITPSAALRYALARGLMVVEQEVKDDLETTSVFGGQVVVKTPVPRNWKGKGK